MSQTDTRTGFLYIYGVIPADELEKEEFPSMAGIDQNPITIKVYKDFAAVFTPVNAQDFSQMQIDLQLKDAEWLKENALHHHNCIETIHQHFTILPLPFCTIFQNTSNLENALEEQYDLFYQKLNDIKEKQEWNIKLFCDTEKALCYVVKYNPSVIELKNRLESMPKGKQFIMKKKLEHLITSQLEEEQSQWWHDIHEQLELFSSDSNLRQNWGKDITERNDEMIVNCDFLIEKQNTEQFLEELNKMEEIIQGLGCTFQITGPWPPYHFSKMTREHG